MPSISARVIGIALALAFAWPAHAADALIGVDSVLKRLDAQGETRKSQPVGESLLADIRAYRKHGATLDEPEAIAQWLALWDRAAELSSADRIGGYGAYDLAINAPVGLRSVIAAVPSPDRWPALAEASGRRAAAPGASRESLALDYVVSLLIGDTPRARKRLDALDATVVTADPAQARTLRASLAAVRKQFIGLHGSPSDIADAFGTSLAVESESEFPTPVEVPDLVALVGADRAERILRAALRTNVPLTVPIGDATRALARRLLIDDIERIPVPHWGLVDSSDTITVFELLAKRFDPGALVAGENGKPTLDWHRDTADQHYLVALILAGRTADAERVLLRMGGEDEVALPKPIVAAVIDAGGNAAIHAFLGTVLERRPELRAWTVYIEQGAYLGRTKESLALIDRILARADLPAYLHSDLARRRADALLAADDVAAGTAALSASLGAAPAADDPQRARRITDAIRLATLGRLLEQPALSERGFDFAIRALALPDEEPLGRDENLAALWSEMRKQGRAGQVQQLALAEFARPRGLPPGFEGLASYSNGGIGQKALLELAGLYDASDRHSDVLRLLRDAPGWGARDAVEIVDRRDSLGRPLGLVLARALKAEGNTQASASAVRALLDKVPGYDPAYELFVDLSADDAAAALDARYALDSFEERPLIWKGIAQRLAGKTADAEATLRQAIAIDPSDGEQGPSDRMRAYAALAAVLRAGGDAEGAGLYERAVSSIRRSEHADELHRVGLYERAFAAYRKALDEFSDAYCIQSRLAVQLGKQGRHDEALTHYRRAFELMPDSFGRVESHCFGCESVFQDARAQGVAESVFEEMVARQGARPQAFYMLGYLRFEQGRYAEALQLFRDAVSRDGDYLNAWKKIHELAGKTWVPAAERDIARLKLFDLDPIQRHVRYDLGDIANLRALWSAAERVAGDRNLVSAQSSFFALDRSAADDSAAIAQLPEAARKDFDDFATMSKQAAQPLGSLSGSSAVARSRLFKSILLVIEDPVAAEFE